VFFQQLVNGISLGSLYALIALGYTLVYGVLRLINFAHGDIFMVGAYLGLLALGTLHWPLAATLALAMCGAALLGVSIERVVYRPLRQAPRLSLLIAAIGVSLFLENLGIITVSADPRGYPEVFSPERYRWVREHLGVVILLISLTLMLGLNYVVSATRFGKAIRAVSYDLKAAELMGVDSNRIIALTFALGSALAGAGGVLYGIYYGSIEPLMGIMPGIKAFVAAVLGGIGSVPGAMLGGLIMGLAEVGVSALTIRFSPTLVFTGSTMRDAVAFAILILILLVKPTGIMGRAQGEKV